MLLDFTVLLLLIWFAFSGHRSGAFHQVFAMVLLVVSFVLARIASSLFDGMIGNWLDVAPRYAGFVGFLVTWAIVYLILRILTGGVLRSWKEARPESGGMDRKMGAVLGVVKGMVGVYFLLSVLVLSNKAVARAAPGLWVHYQGSYVGAFVERHNLFEHLPDRRVQSMVTLVRLASDPDPRKLNADPAALQAFQRLNTQVLSDHPQLRQSLLRGDFKAVVADEGIMRLLDDPAFVQLLDAVDASRSAEE